MSFTEVEGGTMIDGGTGSTLFVENIMPDQFSPDNMTIGGQEITPPGDDFSWGDTSFEGGDTDTGSNSEDTDDILGQAIGDEQSGPSDGPVDAAFDTALSKALDTNTDQGRSPAEERAGDREQAGEFSAADEGKVDEEQDEPDVMEA